MIKRTEFEDICDVTNIKTGVTVPGEILTFKDKQFIVLTINRAVKLHLQWEPTVNVYVGRMAGMEFQSTGPKSTKFRTGR